MRPTGNRLHGGGYISKVVEIDELVDQFAFGIKKTSVINKEFSSVCPCHIYHATKICVFDRPWHDL